MYVDNLFTSKILVLVYTFMHFLEKKRVKLHLMRTEYWMMNQDVSHLSNSQKQNRLQALKTLRQYHQNEQFPINTTHRKRIPQIQDKNGTACALACILQNSGEKHLVEDLARNSNYVLVNDIPDDHHLINALTCNGISKKEASKIQPSYSCEAIVGRIQTGEPIIEFLGIIMSIVGSSITLSFFWGLYHVNYNLNKRTITLIVILGIGVAGSGFGLMLQNSMAEPFHIDSFSGTYGSINIIEDVSVHYWIDGGGVTVDNLGNHFQITPNRDGHLTIAYPPIITKAYRDYHYDNYYDSIYHDVLVLVNGQEIDSYALSYMNGHVVLGIPFKANDSSIDIIQTGLCRNFYFDDQN